jgi:6-hydroxymethylpterin diphosphokinase MptE-like
MTFRRTIKKITPGPVWKLGSDIYWMWHNRGRHVLAKYLDRRWVVSSRKLKHFENMHVHQRCFIIGNGPSLRLTKLTKLRNEITFGLNRIYLLFPELGFTTTYLVAVNDLVLEQCAREMQTLTLPKFVTWRARRWFCPDPNLTYLDTDFTGEENFCTNLDGRIFEGFTVTFVALQLAYHMGFDEVILVGVDHNFITQGKANQTIVSEGDDPNHFAANYFGKGFKWQLPDLAGSERAYTLARQAFLQAGRRIVDATIGGKLTIFPKVEFDTLFKE